MRITSAARSDLAQIVALEEQFTEARWSARAWADELVADRALTIVAKDMLDVQTLQPTDLSSRSYRQLILSIKSEDLLAFRQGKITRDQAKEKTVDTRF